MGSQDRTGSPSNLERMEMANMPSSGESLRSLDQHKQSSLYSVATYGHQINLCHPKNHKLLGISLRTR